MRWSHALIALALVATSAAPAAAHSGHTRGEPWMACEHAELGDACAWEVDGDLYAGTCRDISRALMCVRNEPIVPVERAHALEQQVDAPPAHERPGLPSSLVFSALVCAMIVTGMMLGVPTLGEEGEV